MTRRSTRTCAVDGCEAKHYGCTYCRLHYRRWKVAGDPLIVRPVGGPRKPARPCVVPSCWRRAVCKNLCDMHYKRMMLARLRAKLRRDRDPRTIHLPGGGAIRFVDPPPSP